MQKRQIRLAIVALVCACAASAGQAPSDLDELIAEAIRVNPEVRASQKRYEALRQRPSQEGSLPDPMLSLGYASVGSPRPVAGLGSAPMARVGVMVSQEVPFPGKRSLRSEVALKEAEEALQDYRATVLSVTARIKAAYFRLYYIRQMLRVLEITRDQLQAVVAIAEARYSTGRAGQQDILKAQAQLALLEARRIRLGQEVRTAAAEINSVLARPPDAPVQLPASIDPGELRVSLSEIQTAALAQSPVLRKGRESVDRAGLSLELARRSYYPDATVSAGYFNMGRMADMYEVRVDLKIPVRFGSKQRAAVAEETNRAAQARREYEAAALDLAYQIQESFLAAEASHRLAKLYSETVIPQAAVTLESSLASYGAGRVDFLTVLTNLMSKVESEESYHQELLAYHLAMIRLEELSGTDWLRFRKGEQQ